MIQRVSLGRRTCPVAGRCGRLRLPLDYSERKRRRPVPRRSRPCQSLSSGRLASRSTSMRGVVMQSGCAMSDARVGYATSSRRYQAKGYVDAARGVRDSCRRAQDACDGGSPLPPTIVRRRDRRAASRFSAVPLIRRPPGDAAPAAVPPLARIGDCQRRAAAVGRGARIRERSKATSISAENQQVTITAALVYAAP
jgi:hypothetical protein